MEYQKKQININWLLLIWALLNQNISRFELVRYVLTEIVYTVEPLITDTAGEFKFCPL
jgi:hypothetical protein